jgi:hypothetical protein
MTSRQDDELEIEQYEMRKAALREALRDVAKLSERDLNEVMRRLVQMWPLEPDMKRRFRPPQE